MTIRAGSPTRSAAGALAALAIGCAVAACAPEDTEEAALPADAAAQGACDRACLIGLLDRYLDAVAAHDPGAAPLAPDFHSTQNAMATPAGEGVWASVTALGALQRRYADPETGQALYLGLIGEGDATAIAALRIRAEDRLIAEAEWLIARESMPWFNPFGFTANPPPERTPSGVTRDDAIAAADSYFHGLEEADATGVLAHPDCYRIENGSWMVGALPDREPVETAEAQPGYNVPLTPDPRASCIGGFTNLASVISAVSNRRYFYDEEAGVVWGGAVFERPASAVGQRGQPLPRSYVSNLFVLEDGRIRGINSITMRLAPDAPGSGWPDQPEP